MNNNGKRVVIDTNIWVSMAIGSKLLSEQITQIIAEPNNEIYISLELIEELTETLSKPRLQKYLTQTRTKNLFELIWLKTRLISVHSSLKICRDPKDDFIINLVVDSNSHFLITGDQDLLVLNPFYETQIITPAEFLAL